VANQTSATFLRVVGSELIQKYLGDGPRLVRELFRVADDLSPTIVFIGALARCYADYVSMAQAWDVGTWRVGKEGLGLSQVRIPVRVEAGSLGQVYSSGSRSMVHLFGVAEDCSPTIIFIGALACWFLNNTGIDHHPSHDDDDNRPGMLGRR